ncbi:hypothetical protein ISCGN_008879 [Ixodes scapularis]
MGPPPINRGPRARAGPERGRGGGPSAASPAWGPGDWRPGRRRCCARGFTGGAAGARSMAVRAQAAIGRRGSASGRRKRRRRSPQRASHSPPQETAQRRSRAASPPAFPGRCAERGEGHGAEPWAQQRREPGAGPRRGPPAPLPRGLLERLSAAMSPGLGRVSPGQP